ncbi:DUF2254 domain-containing protein [Streptomyces sp. NBC_00876]|uniref:DUF2254 family protein n=1 Tax=Streptomyces sp. NBC_00876 TaxID=2975853 RepID=UPI003863A005|nr:DUF2254 domain-containing protein [Streptomyces sp. NBC_00876]
MTAHQVRARAPHRGWSTVRDRRARSRLAALLLVAGGAVLGWGLPRWENHLPAEGLGFDASTAQATMAAIAGGMITLSGFVVTAITLVVQTVLGMSPRLVGALGHFSRYLIVFGLLVGTAVFSLVGLSTIRGDDVPRLSVTFAIALVVFDSVAVLYLLASIRDAVTGGGLSRSVGNELRTVIDRMYPPQEHLSLRPAPDPATYAGLTPVVHTGPPSMVSALDEKGLVALAHRHDVRVHLVCAVGDFVRAGQTAAYVESAGPVPSRLPRLLASRIHRGPSRTVESDPVYGLRLLADIAIRALSPAVNDPTTAVQALDQVEDALLSLADRPVGPVWFLDERGAARVFCPAPLWEDFVTVALDETLVYGSSGLQTVRRLRALLDRLADTVPAERAAVVVARRQALERLAGAALPDPFLREVSSHPDSQGMGGPAPLVHP